MSDIIQLLPDSVANQIAAGEVIQRPASVIKELVENAIDAGATNIRVIVVDAGRTSIQVIDNGCGMSETDARLAFERHATSKIRKADDLFALHTMGFRGEALPSIAAVAQVELTTKTADDEIGTRITIQGSHIVSQEAAACATGSSFKVDNLFFNVPARRKFLKTNATELNNILTAFERIVLVYPDISFQLYSNGQELMNLKASSLRQRITDVFGKKINQELLPLEVDTAICHLKGFVGKPESARKKSGTDYFFVNGRFMRHAYFHKAVVAAFDRLIPTGMQVPYFIYFDVSPADIDINIHPTKTEIKFENEQSIWQILSAAVKDAIGKFCDVPAIQFDTEGRPDIPVFNPQDDTAELPKVQYNANYNPFASHGTSHTSPVTPQHHTSQAPADWQELYRQSAPQATYQESPIFQDEEAIESTQLISEKSPEHYQYKGRYIMTAVKSGLMIIDQHRADIRIRYERYLAQMQQSQCETQSVLFPETLQLSASEQVLMQQYLSELTAIGFSLSDLGGGCYAINGVPAGAEDLDAVHLIHNLLSDTPKDKKDIANQMNARMAQSLARHTAIEYGQVLSNEEMEKITNELFACENVNYTPDGRAILCILPQSDIEQLLG